MLKRIASLLVLLLVPCVLPAQEHVATGDELAKRTIGVLAGSDWDHARYFSFSFDVERDGKRVASFPQRWDRDTGDYRVSGKDREGHDFLVIMNVETKQGRAWLDGVEVKDPKDLLVTGYKRFINDTYWLLMPLKMLDPGVHRENAGTQSDSCNRSFDVVKLSFDKVGLTPGDQYWAWINRDTGVVEQWRMLLEGTPPGDPASIVVFHDYARYDGLLISTRREVLGHKQFILLDDLVVADEPPANAFKK
jgi:hypothetical protein